MPQKASAPAKRLRIGVFLGFIGDPYTRDFWRGATRRAEEIGAEIIGYLGYTIWHSESSFEALRTVGGMAAGGNADGAIVLSSSIALEVGREKVSSLVAGLGIPAVSIGYELEGTACVTADGTRAMREIVRHLAADHGRRSFALVTGPADHPESMEREAAVREELSSLGLELDERLLYRGSFMWDDGAAAVRRFLESGLGFDAVVCLNDNMALGASKALRQGGLAASFDAAVTGFDDMADATLSWPSLTTVRQPTREMAAEAVDAVVELIEGRGARSRRLECACVIRESCGCRAAPLADAELAPGDGEAGEIPASLVAPIEASAMAGDGDGAVLALERALALARDEPGLIRRWRSRLFDLRARTACAGDGAPSWFDRAMARLEEIGRHWEAERLMKENDRRAEVGFRSLALLGQFSLDKLVGRWEKCTKCLGIPQCYLVLFDGKTEPRAKSVPARSRLVESSPAGAGIVEGRFPTGRLVPDEVRLRRDCRAWIAAPLVYQEEALGYLLFEDGGCEPGAYEILREIMSSSIKGALLLGEIADSKSGLERQVYFRTIELEEANRGLLGQIERREQLEREVRDISNRTMQAIGQDLHDDLCPYLAGISMLASLLEERLAAAGDGSAAAAGEIHELLRGAVDRSRRYARTLYPPRLAEEGIASALEELVEAQEKSAGGASICFQAEGDIRIDDVDKSLNLFRIVQEALSNALSHSGSDDVIVRLAERGGSILAEVRDFGRGIPPDDPAKDAAEGGRGMGLKIMRYRAEAIGASLEIESLNPGTRVSCVLASG